MTKSIYLASTDADSLKSSIALGLVDDLRGRVSRVGIFRPLVETLEETSPVTEVLRARASVQLGWSEVLGATYAEALANPKATHARIIDRYLAIAERCDAVVVLGTDHTKIGGASELALNARIAADLMTPVALVTPGLAHRPSDIRQTLAVAERTFAENHAVLLAVIASRCEESELAEITAQLATLGPLSFAVPESRRVSAPTVRAVMEAIDGKLASGQDRLLDAEAQLLAIGAMEPHHMLSTIQNGALVIAPGDRAELLLALVAAHADPDFPVLSGVVLTGGFTVPESMMTLITGLDNTLPIIQVPTNTVTTATRALSVRGHHSPKTQEKNKAASELVSDSIDTDALWAAVDAVEAPALTPQRFEYSLLQRAQADPKHIVLPEGLEPRILKAAARIVALSAAELTVLGDPTKVANLAQELGVDLTGVTVQDPCDPALLDKLSAGLFEIRKAKGMTSEQAREILTNSASYLGTMMVQLGLADGMVCGAIHTTADTIRPAFQIIKTVPGLAIVSSVFLMALAEKVLVFGDCAVNPNPTPEQLADIAISSAATAATFGIEPKVAMLSYSTGTSGSGPDVETVRAAVELVRERAPGLPVEGPIQYDAAVDPTVARGKMPNSLVAGQATVLIFPDLNAGNIAYKAVQRSSGALAIGPVLQGLRKPVNDLSRGALVDDIINTVIITAIQAQ